MTTLSEKILRKRSFAEKEIAIDLRNVGKKYTIHHEKPTLIENVGRALIFKKEEEYWALKDVNLKIYKGEKVGFFGSNGSGKTTLLKIITGISSQTRGQVKTNGRIISLIDLEAGFHPDLTGQENVFLNGLVIGMSKEEIEKKFYDIVDFADIGSFITAPLYTYSSGMKLRLGFGIAMHADPDILLLDEIINTGDESIRKKIWESIDAKLSKNITVLAVSQWVSYLEEHCDKVIEVRNS